MVDFGRDLNIGRPQPTTLKDIHNKLDEVEKKVDVVIVSNDEAVEELRGIKLGTGFVTGTDLDEEAP